MMTVVKLKHPDSELVLVNDRDDIEAILREMYPENRIPAEEFHRGFNKMSVSFLKYKLGRQRTYYSISEIADLIWSCSNYEQCIE